jgi:hypothetical protein
MGVGEEVAVGIGVRVWSVAMGTGEEVAIGMRTLSVRVSASAPSMTTATAVARADTGQNLLTFGLC